MEETFPIPLKYIDVTGSTYTDLDVMQEKRVDDLWSIDSNTENCQIRGNFHEVYTIDRKTSQNQEKQKWKNEKPKLDNAQRLRGIYFIGPDDQDCKETHKKCEEKIGKTYAVQKESSDWHHEGGCEAGSCNPKGAQNDL